MPHFVVTPVNGKATFAVEYAYLPVHTGGGKRWPKPFEVIEIPNEVAELPMDTLIYMYLYGVRPKKQIDPGSNPGLPQPQNPFLLEWKKETNQ